MRTATLKWEMPTHNVDGSPMTDLGGYQVFRGLSPQAERMELYSVVSNPEATSLLVITGDESGVYYFRVATMNKLGVRGPMSDAFYCELEPSDTPRRFQPTSGQTWKQLRERP